MAQKNAFDVWIVAANTVYKAVPYNVVTDWVTQGRLLADDRLKLSGTEQWVRLGDTAAFATFLPRQESGASSADHAEFVESMEAEAFEHSHAGEGEDEDVDMIPLIDISLVLLVFFMMTATVVSELANVPKTRYAFALNNAKVWVRIEPRGAGSPPSYSIGEGEKTAAADDRNLSEAQVIRAVEHRLATSNGRGFDVRIVADQELPIELVQRLINELSQRKKDGIASVTAETTEKGGKKS